MARKPVPALPDVFARPGGAPARGMSIEDLPGTAADRIWPEAASTETPATEAGATPPDAHPFVAVPNSAGPSEAVVDAVSAGATPPQADTTEPDQPAPEPAPPIAALGPTTTELPPPHDAVPPSAPPAPPPSVPPAAHIAAEPTGRRPLSGSVPAIVWVILVVSLTAPLWENPLLASLGVQGPAERSAERSATVVAQDTARLGVLEQRLAATNAQLEAMRASVALASQRAADASAQARTVALLQLADALRGSGPFAPELAALRATGGDAGALQPILSQLTPYAAIGAPTVDELRRELRNLNDGIAHAIRQANPGSWMDVIAWTGFGGGQSSARIDPSLRAIQLGLARLTTGDIAGAIEQASQVGDAYQAAVADWVMEARSRLAADAALRQLDAVIARGGAQ